MADTDDFTFIYCHHEDISDFQIEKMKSSNIKKLIIQDYSPFFRDRDRNFTGNLHNLYEGLEELYIDACDFNKPIDHLPSTLLTLHIRSQRFNHPVNNLPPNLEELVIYAESFNQEVDNLPGNLKVLELQSYMFNHNMQNLPPSLETLIIRIGLYKGYLHNFNYLVNLKEKKIL